MKNGDVGSVEIILYTPENWESLGKVNSWWIEKYFEITPMDLKAFRDPQSEIIDRGGYIYFARIGEKIVGSIALEKLDNNGLYALTRMGVLPGCQGLGIGQSLMDVVLDKSREIRVKILILYTNQLLIQALNLYYRNGFKAVPLDEVAYERATIKMEMRFQ